MSGYQNQYQANLTAFIADVRATYGANLPFIVGRLSSAQTNIAAGPLGIVRAAQTAVAGAVSRATLIDTDTFGIKTDNLHFNSFGQQALGIASADALFSYVPFTSPPTIEQLENGDFEITVAKVFPGFLYTLENSANLLPETWSAGDSEIATGTTMVLTYTPGIGDTVRFFRVKRSPAP